MKYNGFYFWMFKHPMKKVLAEKYGAPYAAEIMKKSRPVCRQLVERAVDIGDGNPMAYNELFALAFVSPYVASGKKIPPQIVQEMMRRSLYHIKWYFARTDLNTARGKAENKKSIVKYVRWYTPRRERRYPTSFKVDFDGQPHADAAADIVPVDGRADDDGIRLPHGADDGIQSVARQVLAAAADGVVGEMQGFIRFAFQQRHCQRGGVSVFVGTAA